MIYASIKKYSLSVLLFALALLLPGCEKRTKKTALTPDGKKIITFWHTMNQEESATLREMISRFEGENPDIKINLQPVPFDQAQNKFKIAAQGGDAPDVLRSEIAWTSEEAALGYIIELDGYISDEDREDYLESSLAYNVYQGKIYGIPQVTDCLALLYNKSIFEEEGVEVPRNMEEFRSIGKRLTKDEKGRSADEEGFDPANIRRYAFYFNGKAYFFTPFMWAFGGGLIDPAEHKILVNSKGTVDAINFLIEIRDRDHITPAQFDLKSSYDNMMAGFKEGRYAMITNGPWSTADILTGQAFSDPANLGVAIIPEGPGGFGSPVGGHNFVISRNSPYPDESYRFISFLNSGENQIRLALNNNLLPTRKSAYEDPRVSGNPILSGFKAQLDVARNRPVVPQGGQLFTDFDPYFQASYLGAMSPQQAMDEVAGSWKKLMGW